ncbi:MAG: (2Fe-2S)-binding protein [Bacteroidota bacterium]
MARITLNINGKDHEVDVDPQMPLLWVVRDHLGMKGSKFGCGIAQCGACTMHLNGTAVRTCVFPVSAAANGKITTIEGVSENNDHPIQQAWIEEQVPQCGYCQSGQIMSATSLLSRNSDPSDRDIDMAMQGNICRCGTYPRIRNAIKKAAKKMNDGTY